MPKYQTQPTKQADSTVEQTNEFNQTLNDQEMSFKKASAIIYVIREAESERVDNDKRILNELDNVIAEIQMRLSALADLNEFILNLNNWSSTIANALAERLIAIKNMGCNNETEIKDSFDIINGLMKLSSNYCHMNAIYEEYNKKNKMLNSLTSEEYKKLSEVYRQNSVL